MPKQEPSGEAPDVSVSGSQGVQVGSGNTMYASWGPKPPLDPAALGALNPHAAVARLQELSHNELVDFFARAQPEDVSEILGVFSQVGLSKLAPALADINRRKATELIRATGTNSIDQLPEAAEAIARTAARLKWADTGPLEIFDAGYARRYKNGHVFWSYEFGTRTTAGTIDDFCIANDIRWGFPADDQKAVRSMSSLTDGIMQGFELGVVYSSKYGTYFVSAHSSHEEEGGVQGWLGFPTGEEGNGNFARLQNFEGGTVYTYIKEAPESVALPREIADALPYGWRPVSKEALVNSSSGMTAVHVEGETESGAYETVVYWDEKNKPVFLEPKVWVYYNRLGAEKSWLGFPVGRTLMQPLSGIARQRFEGGTTYWEPGKDAIGVRKAVEDFIFQDRDLRWRLGFPVSEEQPEGIGASGSIQFFQGGVITCRDGKYEVSLRPHSEPESPPGKADESGEVSEATSNRQLYRPYTTGKGSYRPGRLTDKEN
jgi:hypothetical protein